MDLVSALKKDHQSLKKLYSAGLQKKTTLEEKKRIFKKLSVLVPAHSKSEEQALYSNITELSRIEHFAYEGFEEHHLVDQLIRELKTVRENHVWEAKFTVVCELLQHHIDEEEKDLFPKINKMLSPDIRKELGKEYRELFSEHSKSPQKEQESKYIPTHAAH
ncbi:hemerythrin domain-containing protein [Bdellovibrio sp. HCB337]|uniref:hemerythrin domain-containing protein n=1 Tax=Bdellovibrio sp. HCB337 TaxID=3394358 RepID=UPI0039A4727E